MTRTRPRRILSSATRRSSNRAATLLRIAAVNVARTQTAQAGHSLLEGPPLRPDLRGPRRFCYEAKSTSARAASAVFEFTEGWYNPTRRHSSLDDVSPIDVERQATPTPPAAPSGMDVAA